MTSLMSSYSSLLIDECYDPLVEIPLASFAFTDPHPYVVLGAPYGAASPWRLRQRVLDALHRAQDVLDAERPGWRFKLFDAWRPLSVQAFMVWREFGIQAERAGLSLAGCDTPQALQVQAPEVYALLAARVFEFWSMPNDDPCTPPPHSTGAAVDLTLVDASGMEVAMGSPIDETTERSYPQHYANATNAGNAAAREFHANRELLNTTMSAAGFARHINEWWHFSLGDQMWAQATGHPAAIYGRVR